MEKRKVLIVDDEPGVRESLRMVLKEQYDAVQASSGEEALEVLGSLRPDLVLLDVLMSGMDGLAVLERIKEQDPRIPVLMLTATKTVKTAVTAMKLGAFDYVTKPFDVEELLIIVERATRDAARDAELESLRWEVGRRYSPDNIIGNAPRMQKIFRTIGMVAPLKTTVLITGESGTGKELIAKALHYQSPRADKPLVTLNCAAFVDTLLESELFGHERGAFTDAHQKKLGQFELADQGTIFLDEIGELSQLLQAKLLRVIEQGEFMRVGGKHSINVDVRIIAATNRDLDRAIREGTFRSDLYYRLNVVSLQLPPLRERPEDLPLLIKHFLGSKSKETGVTEKRIAPEAVDALLRYPWPGNVRELENVIERVLVLSDHDPIGLDDLPEDVRTGRVETSSIQQQVLRREKSLTDAVDEFEREIIRAALQHVEFNQTRAADLLGTTRRILKYRMDKLGIQSDD
jgi:two-component system, NtrC family, response regulator AtoC